MSDESTEPKSPFAKRGFLFAAIGVGAIGLAAVVAITAAITGGGSDPTPVPTPTAAPTASSIAAEDMSVCGLAGYEEEASLATAPESDWELVGTVAAPTAPDGAGPGNVVDGFRSCFAHTGEGALFAAVNYIALGSDSRNSDRMPELFVPGPGVDIALGAGAESGTPSSARLQVAGFKVNSYSADEAVIDVAWSITSEDGALVSYPVVLRWYDGDWRVVINDDGQPPFAPSQLPNLGGYIPWAGV